MLQKKYLLGVGITPENTSTILENVIDQVRKGKKKLFIVTPNPEIIIYAQKHLAFKDRLNSSDIALADGVGILLASRLLGLGIQSRTTGVDFIEELCKVTREKPVSIGFLGGRPGVAEHTAECLKQKYPWINVVFTGEEWLSKDVKTQQPIDILFVAYGFPKQEEWIYDNLEKLPVKAAMGVGGAFDFISGNVPRAPKPVRSLGFEWLFRLIVQPWRLKRQAALPIFAYLVIKERFSK
jgi:N-acetylglucosaminyldiphosphoundecaprenol N-acetyl-beta-D-mannosaminyltransferase